MMRSRFFLVLPTFIYFVPIANADVWTGNKIYDLCKMSQDFCDGYVAGVGDIMSRGPTQTSWHACVPGGVTISQLKDIAIIFLRDNPQKRHLSAASLIEESLARAFPCR
jgi:hypothetical protein